jgi:hypothetical protein
LNSTEIVLTQRTVAKSTFGKVCSTAVGAIDGQIYAQPLVVAAGVPGYNHPVVYVATMNDTVYIIDGYANCKIIKRIPLLQRHEEAVKCTDVGSGQCSTLAPIIGILGTPVIDTSNNTMYLVTWTESTGGSCPTNKADYCFVHRLHALDIATGEEKYNGPVAIPSVTIGRSRFTAFNHLQRPGLLLLPRAATDGGTAIYVGFSEMDGSGIIGKTIPAGWMFRFDADNLAAAPVAWSTTPNGQGGGLWQSGAGLASGMDQAGGDPYIYVSTGDGTFDAEKGGSDYGDSLVKLTTNLTVADYFTPYRQYCDDINDFDLGSGGVMLIPEGVGGTTTYSAVANGKDGNIYVVARDFLGGYAGPSGDVCPKPAGANLNLETIQASTAEFYSTAAFWNRSLYSVANNSPLQEYSISAACSPGPICQDPVAISANSFSYGTVPVTSSNGVAPNSPILWAIHGNGWPSANANLHPATAVLYAYDAEHVATPSVLPQLWNSNQCPTRDGAGNATKFAVPTVANGKVYIGTMDPSDPTNTKGQLDVYGLNSNTCN